MMIGDHEWTERKSRFQAVKAYTIALFHSFELGWEVMFRVGAHTYEQLLTLPLQERLSHIDRIERSLKACLIRELGSHGELHCLEMLLWPVRLSRWITVAITNERVPSAKEITDFLRKVIFEPAKTRKAE
jgi:hypothetical protein